MATQLFSNNANTTVDSQLLIAGTSLTVASGGGALFSAPAADQYELITLYASDSDYEVVKCTSRTGDVLTIERGHEGTARQWEVGEIVSARVTKDTLETLRDQPAPGQDFYERVMATTENSHAIEIANGHTQKLFMHDTDVTLTISSTGLVSGRAYYFTLIVQRAVATPTTEIDWPLTVAEHPGGQPPTQSAGISDVDIYRLLTLDAGTSYFVFPVGIDMYQWDGY